MFSGRSAAPRLCLRLEKHFVSIRASSPAEPGTGFKMSCRTQTGGVCVLQIRCCGSKSQHASVQKNRKTCVCVCVRSRCAALSVWEFQKHLWKNFFLISLRFEALALCITMSAAAAAERNPGGCSVRLKQILMRARWKS